MGGVSSTEEEQEFKTRIDNNLTYIIKKYGCMIIIHNIILNNSLQRLDNSTDSTQGLEYKCENGNRSAIRFIKTIYKKDGNRQLKEEIVLSKSKTNKLKINEYGKDLTELNHPFTISCSIYKDNKIDIVIDTNNKLANLYILLNWYKIFRKSRDIITAKRHFNINYTQINNLFVSILTLTDIKTINPNADDNDLVIMEKFLDLYDKSGENGTTFTDWKLKWETTENNPCEVAMRLGGGINKKKKSAKKKSAKKKSAKKKSAKKKSAKKRSVKKK